MLNILKKNFLVFFLLINSLYILSDEDPYIFIDENAQKMVRVLTEDSSLFETDRVLYENKIKGIFEPMLVLIITFGINPDRYSNLSK